MSHADGKDAETAEGHLQAFLARRTRLEDEKAAALAALNRIRELSRDAHLDLLAKAGISQQDYCEVLQSRLAQPLAALSAARRPGQDDKAGGGGRKAAPPHGKPPRPRVRRESFPDSACKTFEILPNDILKCYALPGRDQPPGGLNFDAPTCAPDLYEGYPGASVISISSDRNLLAQPEHRPTLAGILYSFLPPTDGNLTVTAKPVLWWGYNYSYPFGPFADAAIEIGAYLEIWQNNVNLTAGAGDLTLVSLHQSNHVESKWDQPYSRYELLRTVPVAPGAGAVIINVGMRVYTRGHWTGLADVSAEIGNDAPIDLQLCGFDLF